MIIAFDVEYKVKNESIHFDPNDLEVDIVGLLIQGEHNDIITKILGKPYRQTKHNELIYIFSSDESVVIPKLLYYLARIVPEDIIILSHNFEYDSKYVNIIEKIKEDSKNYLELRTRNIYSVVMEFYGRTITLVDTAKFEYKPLRKTMNAVRSKRSGMLDEYLISDLLETSKMIEQYPEIYNIIEMSKWFIEQSSNMVGGDRI